MLHPPLKLRMRKKALEGEGGPSWDRPDSYWDCKQLNMSAIRWFLQVYTDLYLFVPEVFELFYNSYWQCQFQEEAVKAYRTFCKYIAVVGIN